MINELRAQEQKGLETTSGSEYDLPHFILSLIRLPRMRHELIMAVALTRKTTTQPRQLLRIQQHRRHHQIHSYHGQQ